MVRELIVAKVKESQLEAYVAAHDHIWPELVEEYREYGISQISCFLYETNFTAKEVDHFSGKEV